MRLFSLINLAVFQLCWFLSAAYQDSGLPIIIILMCIHFLCSPSKLDDLRVLTLALVGVVVDQLLMIAQVIEIPQSLTSALPIWLILLWCVLAWCFNHSLQWLIRLSVYKIAALGAIFGTSSYYAATALNVFTTSYSSTYFVVIMAIVWTFLLPFLTRVHALIIK